MGRNQGQRVQDPRREAEVELCQIWFRTIPNPCPAFLVRSYAPWVSRSWWAIRLRLDRTPKRNFSRVPRGSLPHERQLIIKRSEKDQSTALKAPWLSRGIHTRASPAQGENEANNVNGTWRKMAKRSHGRVVTVMAFRDNVPRLVQPKRFRPAGTTFMLQARASDFSRLSTGVLITEAKSGGCAKRCVRTANPSYAKTI